MKPLLSWGSLLILALGLIVGLGVGLGYWVFSPSAVVTQEAKPDNGGGFLQRIGIGPPAPTEPWKTEVRIQVVNPSTTLTTMGNLANVGIYYAAKVDSLPFLQFLSLDLTKNSPQYSHTVDELGSIITAKYDSNAEQPTIVIQVITPTADEATFLINRFPEVFQDFLVSEESNQRAQTRGSTLQAIEDVKTAIVEAQQQVSVLEANGATSIEQDPTYIALSSRVSALERELTRQVNIIATQTSGNVTSMKQEYDDTLAEIQNVKDEILAAEQKVSTLAGQISDADVVNDPRYLTLTAEVQSLQTRINTIMNGATNSNGITTAGLAEMIANGDVASPAYIEAKTKLDAASSALSDSKKALAIMENQMNRTQRGLTLDYQIAESDANALNAEFTTLIQKLGALATDSANTDTQASFDRTNTALAKARQDLAAAQANLINNQLPRDLDYKVAQAKVDTLNQQLTTLNNNLSQTFVNSGAASQAISSLAVGNPSSPEIVFPNRIKARNALAIGAILGVIIAWAILNRKWLKKVFTSSSGPTE